MGRITVTSDCRKIHVGLAARAATVLDCSPVDGEIVLCDAGENPSAPSGAVLVSLSRGAEAKLTRIGPNRFALKYAAGMDCGALAAVFAAANGGGPVCADPASTAMFALAQRVAAADIPVLVEGPTGTGKEVLARYIHSASARADKPFIAVNCAAMPEAMLEAMLFGHRKGAFTGASEASEGFFRAADGGTLLLDEIGEMPVALQAKLLRTLQEGEVVPLGQAAPVPVDVRIVACTNRDLPTEVAEGRFREDLYYRLNVFPLAIDALRTRIGDIAPLAFAMVLRHCAGEQVPWIGEDALAKLARHPWPGNVRELENVVRRALLLAGDEREIGPDHIRFDNAVRALPGSDKPAIPLRTDGGARLADIARSSEAQAILDTLDACSGNRGATARKLGISERTLRYRMADMREAGLLAAGGAR